MWKPLAGFANRYEISDLGEIRLLTGRVLSTRPDKDGYRMASLWDYQQYWTVKVHQLVLITFVGTAPVKHVADHIDRNASNNRLSNLRWVTHRVNGANRKVTSQSGIKGVRYRAGKPNPWQAYTYCFKMNKFVNLGHFKTKHAAALVAKQYQEERDGKSLAT
jgi:hypothetical protein